MIKKMDEGKIGLDEQIALVTDSNRIMRSVLDGERSAEWDAVLASLERLKVMDTERARERIGVSRVCENAWHWRNSDDACPGCKATMSDVELRRKVMTGERIGTSKDAT